ncbi:type II toxin-antitoxin system VapC family toxin [Ramlibacter sp. 2FC]|uniref:type II toxin-antitoxin system VapC family toxin n=1 Tax=Ramlibacter sp. 2FC TaxID=2502188 RepID=UPI0010F481CB|nr:type II toxin-antitoxin system VapC family toxin [Ramlibacter sp. 2FC]
MNRVYVGDSNIWIDFRNAGLLDKLFRLPFTLCCTDFVLAELDDFDHGALTQLGLLVETLDSSATPKLAALITTHNNSSLADVSCYLLAQETGRPLLTGDGRLRKQAMHDGLEVHGALWLLDEMLTHAVIPPARAATGLEAMLARGARLPHAECQTRLAKWKA